MPLISRGCRLRPFHRADLQQVLYQAATKRGITLRLGCPVVTLDEVDETLAVVIEGGERIEADVIVGADGESTMNAAASNPNKISISVICLGAYFKRSDLGRTLKS
jgi:2-polyprenyl-6-methoxyphenol hydroxylase-like FAD-dependent oxidoreductase